MNDNVIKILKEEFPDITVDDNKIKINDMLCQVLTFLKNTSELSYDILLSIIAIDFIEYAELIYVLFSTQNNDIVYVSINTISEVVSVKNIYPSAHFDECEIYDLFGIDFIGNENLRRLFMPESWKGYPLRKHYLMNDERLAWNE